MSLPEVLAHLRALEEQAGRPAGSAKLVAVTKGQDLPSIKQQVLAYGSFPLAEGRAQELRDKSKEWPEQEWHFIGPLQRNKIKYLRYVRLVHAIEEVWQAQALAEAAAGWGHAPAVLLQVHNGEAQKHGIFADQLKQILQEVRATGLEVRGLMVMAPEIPNKEEANKEEASLEELEEIKEAQQKTLSIFRDTALRAYDLGLNELSMGMSSDYPLAVQAGATLVRVGRSLFK